MCNGCKAMKACAEVLADIPLDTQELMVLLCNIALAFSEDDKQMAGSVLALSALQVATLTKTPVNVH